MKHLAAFIFGVSFICLGENALSDDEISVDHPARQKIADVRVDVDSVYYTGEINKNGISRLIEAIDGSRGAISVVKINSGGGEINDGISFAEIVRRKNLSVEVVDVCFSSCANYVFTAGNKKILRKSSVVGWHGGASQEISFNDVAIDGKETMSTKQLESIRITFEKYMQGTLEREVRFFREIGVQQNITTEGDADKYKEYRADKYSFWTYSIDDMQKYGVGNVHVIGGEWLPHTNPASNKIFKATYAEQ